MNLSAWIWKYWGRLRNYISSLLWLAPYAGGVCVRKRSGEVEILCIAHKSGSYRLPKGRCDFGETLTETAIREIREETGVHEAEIGHVLGVVRDRVRRKKVTFFMIKKMGKQSLINRDKAVVWVPIRAAMKNMRDDAEGAIVAKVLREL